MARGAAEIARALRDHHERHSEQRAHHQPVIGIVKSVGGGTPGFSVVIPDSGFVLDSDDLVVGQAVAQYDQDYGIKVDDSVSLMPLANGDYVAVSVHTGTEATKRKTSGGINAKSGPPGPTDGDDGDFSIDPATGALIGPKTAGAWPSTPLPVGGGAAGAHYTYSSDIAATDPTSGKVKFDSTTLASITACRISETDADGNGLAGWLASFDDSTTTAHRGTLIVTKDGAPTSILILDVTSALTDNGTWDSFTVAVLASNGSFANGDGVHILFVRTGDMGATGTGGATGATGPAGPTGAGAGIRYTYSNDTALTDPTSGKIKFNSTTLASINNVRISETDADGNGLAALLATFDDSTTSGHRGILTIIKDGAPSNMLVLDVTGALTDNGTWDNFNVTPLVTTGSFANGDTVRLSFERSGDAGLSGVLTPTAKSATYTAVSGDLIQTTNSFTITLPTPTAGRIVGVQVADARTYGAPVTITTPSGVIVGPGIGALSAGAASMVLGAPAAFVVLEADGTNWRVTNGAADTGWYDLGGAAGGFQNSWLDFGGGYVHSGCRKIGNRVTFRGIIKNAFSLGAPGGICVLPVNFGPSGSDGTHQYFFACVLASTTASVQFLYVYGPDATPSLSAPPIGAATASLDLCCISYLTD